MTYRDMTFCADGERCTKKDCYRQFTEEDKDSVQLTDIYVSWASFAATCPEFKALTMTPEEFAIEEAALKYAAQQVALRAEDEEYGEVYQRVMQGEEE